MWLRDEDQWIFFLRYNFGLQKVVKKKKSQEAAAVTADRKPRSVYVMRHGERCDFVFSRNWCDKCFDSKGEMAWLFLLLL